MVARGALTLALAGVMGCGPGAVDLVLDLPEVAGARTLVVGVPERSDFRVRAWDLTDPKSSVLLELEGRPSDDPPLEAAFFARGLDEAGLTAGWLPPPSAGQTPRPLLGQAGALGRATEIYQAALASSAGWRATSAAAARLSSASIGRSARRCESLSAVWTSDLIPAGLGWSVQLDAETIFFVGVDGSQWVIDLERRAVDRLAVRTDYIAGARADDIVFMADRGRQVWSGRGDDIAILADPVALGGPLPGRVVALTASAADDVTALLGDGAIHHFDGEAWARWGVVERPGRRIFGVGPREALVLTGQPRVVFRARDGAVQAEVVGETGILSAAATPVGTVAGSSDGDLFVERPGGWAQLGDRRFGWWVMDLVPYAGGVGFILASGTVSAYLPESGFCDALFNGGFYSQGRLHALGDRLVVLGDLPDTLETQVVLLE